MLDRFPGESDEAKRREAVRDLKKPEKPNSSRWETLYDAIVFVSKYLELIQCAFDWVRVTSGSGAKTGSVPFMCAQVIKWIGSPKLCAHLELAREFAELWMEHNQLVGRKDEFFGVDGRFAVFSRPRRSLDLLLALEDKLKDNTGLEILRRAYGELGNDANLLYLRLYQTAIGALKRNAARYFSGMYLLGGFGDPEFCSSVWNALSTWKRFKHAPSTVALNADKRAVRLLVLMREIELGGFEKAEFDLHTSEKALEDVYQLVVCLREHGADAFVEEIVGGESGGSIAQCLRNWIMCLSNTQCVEKTFQDHDYVDAGGRTKFKGKGSKAQGKRVGPDLNSAAVTTTNFVNSLKPKTEKKKPSRAKRDISSWAERTIDGLTATSAEWARAAADCKAEARYYHQPNSGDGLSLELREKFLAWEMRGEATGAVKKSIYDLMEEGRSLEIEFNAICSEHCMKLTEGKRRGRGELQVCCSSCQRSFHVSCMVAEDMLQKLYPKKQLEMIEFSCSGCGGSKEKNAPKKGVKRSVIEPEQEQEEEVLEEQVARKKQKQKGKMRTEEKDSQASQKTSDLKGRDALRKALERSYDLDHWKKLIQRAEEEKGWTGKAAQRLSMLKKFVQCAELSAK
jgi:hypothetical protein